MSFISSAVKCYNKQKKLHNNINFLEASPWKLQCHTSFIPFGRGSPDSFKITVDEKKIMVTFNTCTTHVHCTSIKPNEEDLYTPQGIINGSIYKLRYSFM
jgi:invasion protein IalB